MWKKIKSYPEIGIIMLIVAILTWVGVHSINAKEQFYEECDKIHSHQECRVMRMSGGHEP